MRAMSEKIYALVMGIPEQMAEIHRHCFGDCGKIRIGGPDLGPMGPAFPCVIEDCPHKEADMEEPVGDFTFQDGAKYEVHLRKLKERRG